MQKFRQNDEGTMHTKDIEKHLHKILKNYVELYQDEDIIRVNEEMLHQKNVDLMDKTR
jgi:hypothetical protein